MCSHVTITFIAVWTVKHSGVSGCKYHYTENVRGGLPSANKAIVAAQSLSTKFSFKCSFNLNCFFQLPITRPMFDFFLLCFLVQRFPHTLIL